MNMISSVMYGIYDKGGVLESFGGVASSGSAVNSCSRSEGKAMFEFHRQKGQGNKEERPDAEPKAA